MICSYYEDPSTVKICTMSDVDLNDVKAKFLNKEVSSAIESGNSKRLLVLIKRGVDINVRDEHTGESYLHLVVEKVTPAQETKWVPFIYLLSNEGIDLNARDNKGNTALQLSIKKSLLEIMVACLKVGAEPDTGDEELIPKYTGIFCYEFHNWFQKLVPGYWDAVRDNNTFRVNKLSKSWCRINIHRGTESLIEFAKRTTSDHKIITILVQHEASIDFAHATISGDEERMRLLLCDDSVDLQIKDFSHREDIFSALRPLTLKQAALRYRQTHVLHLLEDQKFPTNSRRTKSAVCSIS